MPGEGEQSSMDGHGPDLADQRLSDLLSYLRRQQAKDLIVVLPFGPAPLDRKLLEHMPCVKALLSEGYIWQPDGLNGQSRYDPQHAVWTLPGSTAQKVVFAGPWWQISKQMIMDARQRDVRVIAHRTWGVWFDSPLRSLVALKVARRVALLPLWARRVALLPLWTRRVALLPLWTRRMSARRRVLRPHWWVALMLLPAKRVVARVPLFRRAVRAAVPPEVQTRLLQLTNPPAAMPPSVDAFRGVLAGAHSPADYVEGRIVLACGSLQPGGAERQVVATLLGLARCNFESVQLLCDRLIPNHPERYDHYLPALRAANIEARNISTERVLRRLRSDPALAPLRAQEGCLGTEVVRDIAASYLEYRKLRPEVVHAWLDWTNVRSGVAAALAGVPKIIVSGRNLNPSHFAFHQGYMAPAYKALAELPNVVFLNNSRAGALDYAAWLGLPQSRIKVIYNGVALEGTSRAPREAVAAWRRKLGIPADHALVGSMFRLYPEKRPLLWVECAAEIAARRPKTSFVVHGQGILHDGMLERAHALGIRDNLILPGVTDDAVTALSAMDVLLLTSSGEGTPNVALEAQWLGVPVVATNAGGVAEAIDQGHTGVVLDGTEADILAAHVVAFLEDSARLAAARAKGREFVGRHFGQSRMIRETIEIYGYAPEAVGFVEEKNYTLRPDARVEEHRRELDRYLSGVPFASYYNEIIKAEANTPLDREFLALSRYFGGAVDGAVLELGSSIAATILTRGSVTRGAPVVAVERSSARDQAAFRSDNFHMDLGGKAGSRSAADHIRKVEGEVQDPRVLDGVIRALEDHEIDLLMIEAHGGSVERDLTALAPFCGSFCYVVINGYLSCSSGPATDLIRSCVDDWVARGKLRQFGVFGSGTWVGQLKINGR